MKPYFFLLLSISLFSLTNSCSKKEPLLDLDQESFYGVGKWKIKKGSGSSSTKQEACDLTDLILNSNRTFKMYFADNSVLIGTYVETNATSIQLSTVDQGNIGSLRNIQIVNATISFEIDLTNRCQSTLEGEKDESYEENKTYIADTAFESYLIEQGWDDVVDNYVLTSSIATVQVLNLESRGITSLVGIEDFRDLQGLSAPSNLISGALDLSSNTNLTNVILPFNPIGALYFRNNPALENLWAYDSQTLEKLEISNSPNLASLTIHNNLLTELDLRNSPNIFNLRIWDSKLSELDLSFASKLEYLIAWDTFNESNEGRIQLPVSSSLKVITLGQNRLKEVDLTNTTKVERLDLDGNQLTTIDFSQTPLIRYLAVSNNALESLDLSSINDLYWLRAHNNSINCIQLNENQLSAIPPSCDDLGLPDYSEEEEESCYNTWVWIEEDFFPIGYTVSSSWVVDPGTTFSLECN